MKSTATRWWALGAITLGVLAAGLDATVLSVALPTLAAALHATETDLQWFVSGYLLVLSAAMLPAGLLGDRFGRRRVMIASLALFAAGSLACALSPTPAAFIAARALLGLASAGVIVMALSALTVLFSEAERPRAVGIWAAANFLSMPIGPLLGGWLLAHYWWGWVFLMNVPVALVGLLAALLLVPETRAARAPDLDLLGVLLSSAGLTAVTYALIAAGEDGWTGPRTLAAGALGALLLVGFGAWEAALGRRPGRSPLVDLGLFRSPAFTWGTILAALGILAMFGSLFTMPQYFQAVQGTDAMGSGVRLLPLIGGLVAGAVPADRLARRVGARLTVATGFGIMAVALIAAATTRADSGAAFVGAWMAGVGLGMGLAMATAAAGALGELPEARSGVGAALMQALQKLGGPFGAAIMGSVLASGYRSHLAGVPGPAAVAVQSSVFGGLAVANRLHSAELAATVRSAFVAGMDASLLASAAIAGAGLLLTLALLPARAGARAPEERVVLGT